MASTLFQHLLDMESSPPLRVRGPKGGPPTNGGPQAARTRGGLQATHALDVQCDVDTRPGTTLSGIFKPGPLGPGPMPMVNRLNGITKSGFRRSVPRRCSQRAFACGLWGGVSNTLGPRWRMLWSSCAHPTSGWPRPCDGSALAGPRAAGVPRGGLPAPEEAEPLPMPAEKRLGLPYSQRLVPVEPPGELRQG